MGSARIAARVEELLRLVGLDPAEYAKRHPRELSGGQRQRVGVARALAADPPILLMDEPFGALDPVTRAELQREFRALARRLNKTIVFVTHDIREALLLASRIALLHAGRLVALAAPEEFLRLGHPEVHAFADSLSMFPTESPHDRVELLPCSSLRNFQRHPRPHHSRRHRHGIAVGIAVPLGMLIVQHRRSSLLSRSASPAFFKPFRASPFSAS